MDVEEKRNKERRLRLRAQNFSYIASAVAVVAIVLGFFAFYAFQSAKEQAKIAQEQANIAKEAKNDANQKLVTALEEKSDRLNLQRLNAERALKVYEKAGHQPLVEQTRQEIQQFKTAIKQTQADIKNAQ